VIQIFLELSLKIFIRFSLLHSSGHKSRLFRVATRRLGTSALVKAVIIVLR